MSPYYISLAFLAGALTPLQFGINASLSKLLGCHVSAATISFSVGALALIIYLVASNFVFSNGTALSVASLRAIPLWTLVGGLLGAIYVATTIACVPQLGSTLLIVLVVAGQMIISLLFDHFGVLGLPPHPINLWRILGVLILLAGVVIVVKN